MDCITSVQKAIDYMEEHILENINYEDVAKEVYMSNYHFHRTFRMLTGLTANEYMRNRRMSLSAQELLLSDVKVIDIAYKYGYDSSESYTKSFTRFHGVSPSVARRMGKQLKLYNRLNIKIIVEGGMIMDYKVIHKEAFQLIVKGKQFRNEIISEEGNTEIPDLWKESAACGVFDVLRKHSVGHDVYGVCSPISKDSGYFDYGIGMLYDGSTVPQGYHLLAVKPTLWAIFPCIGENGDCIGETWDRIFKEFLPASGYDIVDETDIEFYPAESDGTVFCEIWLPVVKK